MSNELSPVESGLVKKLEGGGLGEVLKPLIQEIHLFDSFVAGTSQLSDKSVLEEVRVNDKLTLLREDSKFDSNAIILYSPSGKKIGYVPEKDNVIFARLLDAGKKLSATISRIEKKGSFTKIAVKIFLVDF